MPVKVALPPEGLMLRDFMVCAIAEVARRAQAGFELRPHEALIDARPEDLASKYAEVLSEASQRKAIKLSQPDKSAKSKLLGSLGARDLGDALSKYRERLEHGDISLDELLSSLAKASWDDSANRGTLKLGIEPKIPAIQLFKLNYYAGKRSYLQPRYVDADVYLDLHHTVLTLTGAVLSRVGTTEDGKLTVYLVMLDPGAYELHRRLSGLLRELRCRTAPSTVFEVALALELARPGVHPLRLAEVNETGARPSLLEYRHIALDILLSSFANLLSLSNRRRLLNLLVFTLSNWETSVRDYRVVVRVGHDLAQSIYLSVTGSLRPSDALYHVARSTYATSSSEFAEALSRVKIEGLESVDEFKSLLMDVVRAAEECVRAP